MIRSTRTVNESGRIADNPAEGAKWSRKIILIGERRKTDYARVAERVRNRIENWRLACFQKEKNITGILSPITIPAKKQTQ